MLFFDTSALVKRYAVENGTEVVDSLIEGSETPVVITSLSIVETTSAFRRKYNRDQLSERQRDDLLVAFFEEATESFTIVPVEDIVFEEAFSLVLDHDLRTLDALQLASAFEQPTGPGGATFVAADQKLLDVAADHGLETIDPTSDSPVGRDGR